MPGTARVPLAPGGNILADRLQAGVGLSPAPPGEKPVMSRWWRDSEGREVGGETNKGEGGR